MDQRSEEWFAARVGVITGSRIGSILGVNPYQTEEQVMRDMIREAFGAEREFKGNAATNHGEKMEPEALAFYEANCRVKVTQTGFVKHDEYEWLGASPDGLIGIDGGLEIKCPYWAKTPYSVHDKPSYYAQCQLVMEVCDIEWMDFLCYINPDNFSIERIDRDRNWFTENLTKLTDFHNRYIVIRSSPEDAAKYLADLTATVEDIRSERLVELYGLIRAAEEEVTPLKDEFDQLKKELGAEYGTFQAGNLKVTRIEKRGSVNTKKLYADVGIEGLLSAQGKTLDDYRNDPVISFNVTAN